MVNSLYPPPPNISILSPVGGGTDENENLRYNVAQIN